MTIITTIMIITVIIIICCFVITTVNNDNTNTCIFIANTSILTTCNNIAVTNHNNSEQHNNNNIRRHWYLQCYQKIFTNAYETAARPDPRVARRLCPIYVFSQLLPSIPAVREAAMSPASVPDLAGPSGGGCCLMLLLWRPLGTSSRYLRLPPFLPRESSTCSSPHLRHGMSGGLCVCLCAS